MESSIKHQIFYFPEAKSCLDSLCELRCDTSTDSSYFYGLASICQYIQKIIIINTNTKVNDGTVKLIEAQKNLRYFEWNDNFFGFDYDIYFIGALEDPYSKNFLALTKHENTLNHFKINFWYEYEYDYDYHYTFMQDLFPKFLKLKSLKFEFPPFSSIDYEEKLNAVVYHDLETLEFNKISTVHTVTCIIKNSGGYLRKISLYDCFLVDDDDVFNDGSLNLIRIIHENCPLVEYLTLPVFSSSDKHFNEFEKLLETCQKLQSLYFQDAFYLVRNLEYTENLLNVLIKAAPVNLKKIWFSYDIEFSVKILETFLEKWRGRPAISLYYLKYRGSDYVNLINKYENEGVIKYYD